MSACEKGRNDVAHAIPSQRELLHIAMAEIVKTPEWWRLPENQAMGLGIKAARGALDPTLIRDEFRALRKERGLPEVPDT